MGAFKPAFVKANLTLDTADPAVYPADKAAALVSSCLTAYLGDLTAAGVSVASLGGLSGCNFTNADELPTCLVQLLTPLPGAARLCAQRPPGRGGRPTAVREGARG